MNTYTNLAINSFRINTYKKGVGGGGGRLVFCRLAPDLFLSALLARGDFYR
jgi:hypothetical protein